MFLLSYYLSRCQIQIPLLENKVNNFFRGRTEVLSGRHYNAIESESNHKMLKAI